jgi:hypothetical protein
MPKAPDVQERVRYIPASRRNLRHFSRQNSQETTDDDTLLVPRRTRALSEYSTPEKSSKFRQNSDISSGSDFEVMKKLTTIREVFEDYSPAVGTD